MKGKERLFKYLKPMRMLLIVAIVFALIYVASQIAQPFLLGKALDASKEANKDQFLIYTIIALVLAVIGTIFAYFFEVIIMNVSQRIIKKARDDVYEKINSISVKDMSIFLVNVIL